MKYDVFLVKNVVCAYIITNLQLNKVLLNPRHNYIS